MERDELTGFPTRPESVADWEDLLVRLEIVPRMVRNTVEEVDNDPTALHALREAGDREAEVGRWLEIAAQLGEPEKRQEATHSPDLDGLVLRFASLRARTFAMLQRRGLEVWRWEGPLTGGEPATVHQLLLWLVGRDARLLADLRQSARAGSGRC